eukprot:TRINITY_DN7338_c0_g1_i1.p1 TRINITY_DN7338_c0_g1~~TRINITY_DN7338_c0_g1_i1.p1  ORF type:complete len:261 (-),score=47.06 TRINITY_DN7338_c0_g1_i1:21-728(-)
MAGVNCDICFDTSPTNFPKPTKECAHWPTTCKACITEHLDTIVHGCSVSSNISYSAIKCIYKTCKKTFGHSDLKSYLSEPQLKRLDELQFNEYVEQDPDFRWCASPTCGSGQIVEGGEEGNNFFTCIKCKEKTCVKHKVAFHTGVTCSEFDKTLAEDEAALQLWKEQNTKKCPAQNCQVNIEKNGGCDHMKCFKCKHEFCWSCLAPFEPIRRDGNHHHRPTCRFYAAYTPVSASR